MLALGETAILPGLVLMFVLFSASIWTLIETIKGKHNAFMISFAAALALIGAAGIVAIAKDVYQDWPPDGDVVFTFAFWGFPLAVGTFCMVKISKARRTKKTDESAKAPSP